MPKALCALLTRLPIRILTIAALVVLMVAAALPRFLPTPDPVAATRGPVHIPVALTGAIDEAPTTVGVADSVLYTLEPDEIERTLDELKALGVNDIRIAVPWVYIQPTGADSYDWAKLDVIVDAAEERDMNILGVINGTPAWAGFPLNGHTDPDQFAEFAGAVATRYEGRISAYEVWNEPNGFIFYNPVSAAAYTEMLKAAYPAIKAADPEAEVIGGVLGAVVTVPFLTQSPESFVAEMYANGAQGSFDALSFHPYQYSLPFSLGADVANSPLLQVSAIRDLMVANGDGDLKIWITEYGVPTNQASGELQAALIRDFVSSWQGFDYAGPVFVYTTRDQQSGHWDAENNFGIFFTDWTPKEAAFTVAELIAELEAGTLVHTPFDTSLLPTNDGLTQLISIISGIASFALIVPRALGQFAVSVATAVLTVARQAIEFVVGAITGALTPAGQSVALADDIAATAAPLAAGADPGVESAQRSVVADVPVAVTADSTDVTADTAELVGPVEATEIVEVVAPETLSEPAAVTPPAEGGVEAAVPDAVEELGAGLTPTTPTDMGVESDPVTDNEVEPDPDSEFDTETESEDVDEGESEDEAETDDDETEPAETTDDREPADDRDPADDTTAQD